MNRIEGFLQHDTVEEHSHSTNGEKIVVKSKGSFVFLHKDEIRWIEAEGAYSLIHTSGETIRIRKGITLLEAQLDPHLFCRINRSAILNLHHVRVLRPWRRGDYQVIMEDGSTLYWSRSFNSRLEELLDRVRSAPVEV